MEAFCLFEAWNRKKGEKMGRIFKGKDEGSRQGAAAAFKAAVMAVVISAFYILHDTMF